MNQNSKDGKYLLVNEDNSIYEIDNECLKYKDKTDAPCMQKEKNKEKNRDKNNN